MEASWRPRLRVLCLHGRCQTSEVFKSKLERLVTKAASFATFVFVDGPLELPLQHGEKENTRGWSEERGSDTPEVREVLATAWFEQGPFDAVLGFSEGASVALLYCRLAAAATVEVPTFGGLRCAVLAGAPAPAGVGTAPLAITSLHCFSPSDTVVPMTDSRKCAQVFAEPKFCQHTGGHGVPLRVEEMELLIDFLKNNRNAVYPSASLVEVLPAEAGKDEDPRVCQEQQDELETLAAMYPEELTRVLPHWPVRLNLQILGLKTANLRFCMPPAYPSSASCLCEFYAEESHITAHSKELLAAVKAASDEVAAGEFCVLAMAQAAEQWVADHADVLAAPAAAGATTTNDGANDGSDDEDGGKDAWWNMDEENIDEVALAEATQKSAELLPSAGISGNWAREAGASAFGKPWECMVGLVGKPSVGKSTLFNAITRAEKEAAMDPRPFTTIAPNIAPGHFAAPCPAVSLGFGETVQPEYGCAVHGRRMYPIQVKDVAGLVPGAYLGRGRGNVFLQDLCDADSLIHVVDGSGRSDSEGVDLGDVASPSNPIDEIGWVRREIHLWIFCNVRRKWSTIRRKAKIPNAHDAQRAVSERLFSLFTGYRTTAQLAQDVYEAAGFNLPNILPTVLGFREADLHLLVACFLRVRFPIVIALNKIDVPNSVDRVRETQAKLGDSCVPVAARVEYWLYDQQRRGHLTYSEGGGSDTVQIAATAPTHIAEQWAALRSFFENYSSTGVLEVVSAAVLRRRPVFVCPVNDFATCQSIPRPTDGAKGSAATLQTLSTMVMLRPLSTVEEAFSALRHEHMLRGDFVRAEVLELKPGKVSNATRVLKRDDTLQVIDTNGTLTPSVIRILTNRKTTGR